MHIFADGPQILLSYLTGSQARGGKSLTHVAADLSGAINERAA
jgi:hypothetical protein